jgi:hypothetical protein
LIPNWEGRLKIDRLDRSRNQRDSSFLSPAVFRPTPHEFVELPTENRVMEKLGLLDIGGGEFDVVDTLAVCCVDYKV